MLEVKNLSVNFQMEEGIVRAVRNVSLSVSEGEFIGIVGESGCGKSTLALSIMNLVDYPGRLSGNISFNGSDILKMAQEEMIKLRGKSISMIFQDPFSSLNPVISIGEQIMEVLREHEGLNGDEAKKKAIELLGLVKIKDPEKRLNEYPHQFSGGMKQRIMIAQAIASKPKLLIADEPTTALDVIVQKGIMDLLIELKEKLKMTVLLITHNIVLASQYTDRFYVMYAGEIMEAGGKDVIRSPRNPYTYMLLKCLPEANIKQEDLEVIPGKPPNMMEEIKGCPFSERCEFAQGICRRNHPDLSEISDKHFSRCLRVKELEFK